MDHYLTIEGSVQALCRMVQMRDPYTATHQCRVADLAFVLSREMGLSAARQQGVRVAARLHDIGKIGVPSEILSKPGQLTECEFDIVKTHAKLSAEILSSIDFPWPVVTTALQHHERVDGSGYPYGLAGDEIIQEARIVAVADVVEAMSSHRPYRPALGLDIALEEIYKYRGVKYDSKVVDVCLRLCRRNDGLEALLETANLDQLYSGSTVQMVNNGAL